MGAQLIKVGCPFKHPILHHNVVYQSRDIERIFSKPCGLLCLEVIGNAEIDRIRHQIGLQLRTAVDFDVDAGIIALVFGKH